MLIAKVDKIIELRKGTWIKSKEIIRKGRASCECSFSN